MAQSQLSITLQGKDNLTPVIKNAQKSLVDMGSKSSKLDDIQKSFDKIQNSSVPLSKKIKDIKKQMEQLIVTGQKETVEGKKMWTEMSKAAQQYDAQLRQIQKDTKTTKGLDLKGMGDAIGGKMGLGSMGSQIGAALTNPYVLAGAAIAGAGKALYDYNVELDRSLQKTAQFTGLSGNELMSLRNGIKSVADTFGKDYDTVLASVDGLMNQFGIDGEEALQIINKGFIGGADESGRMLDMISQYSGAFNDAGISASELVAIIGNTRSGIFSEEGMDLFAKGAKNVREFSSKLQESLEGVGINAEEMYQKLQSGEISTVDAIKQISTKLKDLNPQSQEVGEVLKQVFGKQGSQAGLELVTALSEVETNLDIVKEQTGEWGQAMEQLQQADRELENALASLFGSSSKGFSTMTTKLKAEVYGAVAKVINGFIDWYNKSLLVRGAIAGLGAAFKNTWEIIKAILKIFMGSVQALGEMIEGVLTLDWSKIKAGWKNGMSNLLKTIATGFENIKENVENAADTMVNGKIEKIEVPAEVDFSPNKHTGTTGGGTETNKNKGGKSGKNTKSKSTKTEVVKTELELKEEELKKVESKVQNSINNFNKGLITKDELQQSVDEANKYFEEHGIKEKIDLDFSTENGFEKAKQKTVEKIKTPIEEAKKKWDEAIKELNSVNPFEVTEERLEELKKNVIDAENTYNKFKEALSTEITPSIQNIDTKKFTKGSIEDKRQSLANANSIAEQYKADYKLGLIGFDEVQQKFAELNQQLQELDPNLKLDLHINDDGTITTATEDLELYKNKMDAVSDTVGSFGNVFGSLGSAVGGTSGEILNFAGTTISAIGQIIPQMVGLIAAQNAEAIAAGTASGAALPFPANIAAIASIIATIAGIFASLPQFSTGGVVGGTSYSGDKILARLNSGEGVLTRRGMNNLEKTMNNSDNTTSLGGNVHFRISGRDLVGVMNNYNSKMSKL